MAVQVIVVKCSKGENGYSSYSSYGDRLIDKEFATQEAAMIFGEPLRGDKLCIIVRPKYNERDDKGEFFREWRSFDGKDFKEVRWNLW